MAPLLALLAPPARAQMPAPERGSPPSSAPAARPGAAVVALTLDSAIDLAVRVATPVQAARFTRAIAGSELARSYGGFLPSVGGSVGRTVTTGNVLVGARAMQPWETQFETMGYQVTTSLNVLGGLGAYPAVRAAEATRQAADLSLARTRDAVALDVSQAYLQAVLDSELVAIARQNATVSTGRVSQLTELVRVGKRPPADLYRAQAQASADSSAVFDAENRRRADVIALLQRLHIDPQQPITLTPPQLDTASLGAAFRDTTRLVDDALRARPDLRSALTDVDATRWSLRRASREALPSLTLGVTVFSTGRVFDRATQAGVNQIAVPEPPLIDQVGNQTATLFSVGVGYNLLDVFRSRLDRQEATVLYQSARLSAGDVRRQVMGDVARGIGEYDVASRRLASAAVGLDAAQQAYDLVSGRFEVGFSSIVDLLTAQAALFQARSLDAQAVIQLSLAKRALAFAIGRPPSDKLE